MSTTRADARSRAGSWVFTGAVMGIVAGIVFAMFEMIVAQIMGDGFFMPLRMIGAIVLGQGALEPSYPLVTAAIAGVVVHMVLSAIYGAVFGAIASAVGVLRANRGALVGAATVFGLLLWLVNFYVIAPVLFPWFLMANPVVQFVAHTFFFGTALGLLLGGAWRKDGGIR
jgi:hypothetical protein